MREGSQPQELWKRLLAGAAILAGSLVLAALSFFFVGLLLGRLLPHGRIAFYSFPVGGHSFTDANIDWSLLIWTVVWVVVLRRWARRPTDHAKLEHNHERR